MKKPNSNYDEPPIFHINHLYESALYAAKATDLESGIHILKQGLDAWPDVRDREIEKLRKELE